MTPEEAIVWCDDFRDNIIKAGKVEEKYSLALRAMKAAMTALVKMIPQKPIGRHTDYKCPMCERRVRSGKGSSSRQRDNFCQRCGQALDWRE